jgi:hypothetical protein
MHDIDRTQSEFESETDQFEFESDQFEFTESSETYDLESPFDEAEEMELAAELLGVSSDAELDQFLGNLFKKAWRGIRKVGSFVGRIARPLGGVLKGVAKKALPYLAGAAGTFLGGPAGGAIGSTLGSAISKAFEMEFAGMNPEDQELEMARRFVRIAGTAAKQAALAQPGVDPMQAVKSAVTSAAQKHMPNLPATTGAAATSAIYGTGKTGRWIRRGRKIVLLGV